MNCADRKLFPTTIPLNAIALLQDSSEKESIVIIISLVSMNILQKLKQKAKQLKSEVKVLIIAYKDKRTPLAAKILIGLTAGYLLSPIDLIPDFIPVLGLLDDLIIVPLLIRLSIKLIPQNVLNEAREEAINNSQPSKNNWLFAIIIILIWLGLIYIVFKQLKHVWS